MVRKLFICLLLLFCFNSTVYGATVPEMSKNLAQNILDYYSNEDNLVVYVGTNPGKNNVINILKNTDAERFANYFNLNFINIINNNSTAREWNLTFNNITTYGLIYEDSLRLIFYVSNNASPNGNNLTFQKIEKILEGTAPYMVSPYDNSGYTAGFWIEINSNNNFSITDFVVNFTPQFGTLSTFDVEFSNDYSIVYFPFQYALSSTQEVYYSNFSPSKFFLIGNYYKGTNSDGEDTGGDIEGDTSGDTGGNVDLSGIQTGIDNINNNLNNIENKIPTSGDVKDIISGEVNKVTETLTTVPDLSGETITSGEIEDALNIEFMADPYDNFWFELTTGLSHALTDNIRQYDIPWINGYKQTFNLDTWGLKFPPAIEFILMSVSTISFTWVIVKYWKIIVDKISSGSIDDVLAMNEEEGIIDLF